MKTDHQTHPDPSPALEQVLAAYLEATEHGQSASRETWLAKHAHVADGLNRYFEAVDAVSSLTQRIRPVPLSSTDQICGSYLLLHEIGRGGMGVVYRARHLLLDRVVALKLIRTGGLLASGDTRRFQNEAEAASRLDHPNIVPIYEFGEHDGQFYFTMKLVDGTSLADWRPLDAALTSNPAAARMHHRRIANVMLETARAVHHAHQRGILHRDLKPSNILLDHEAHAFVADFGLARQIHGDSDITQAGTIVGTPSYMAPEQALPAPFDSSSSKESHRSFVTTAADVYGLGAVLYFLLTGRPPFRGETPLATLALVRDTEAPSPASLNSAVDGDLNAICRKCLEKEPNRRYESAEALAQDLDRWLRGQPTLARPPRPFERNWRWCRRNQLLTGLLGTIVVLSVFGVVSLAVGITAANRARNDAISQRQAALANLRAVIAEINDLENRRPDLDEMRLELLTRIQKQLEPMLNDSIHGSLADETNFWLEIDAGDVQKLRGRAVDARRQRSSQRTSCPPPCRPGSRARTGRSARRRGTPHRSQRHPMPSRAGSQFCHHGFILPEGGAGAGGHGLCH